MDILQGQALFRREKNVDLLTSCQCLTICKKIVFYLLKVYSFPKNYFYFWNILKKWHWFWPPPPLLKCHSYSHIQNLIFFWDPPPFLHNVTLFTDFFFEVFPKTYFGDTFLGKYQSGLMEVSPLQTQNSVVEKGSIKAII